MNRYVNYHSHSYYSNIMTPDSCISNRDRVIRSHKLGHKAFSVIEHGWTGRFIEGIELGKEFGIKPLIGSEAYFVKDRLEKDATNAHVIIIAKNENGRKKLNLALSEANLTGFYYKPRLDLSLILGLPSNDIWITTACLGGVWKYGLEDAEEIILRFKEHFGMNFFLEVQCHNTDSQKQLNKEIIRLSNKHYINIIAGMDSHMISQQQELERNNYLKSRGIEYPDEQNWYLDFPSYDEIRQRFETQGVLNKYKIDEALNNTLIFENVEEYDSPIFNHEIKLPSLYPNKKQEEKNEILSKLVYSQWEKEKSSIPSSSHPIYESEIKKELKTVFQTNMADYFLLDYEIIKKGKEMDGSITMTGRGSAPSFYLSKLLGFTTIDRISAPIKMFPERFMSTERLLEAKNLPDIDFNLGTPEIFANAQSEVMGDGHSYQMIAFGTVKTLGAWKMHARVQDLDFEVANDVSDQLRKYSKDIIHAQANDKDIEIINEYDYIDKQHHDMYTESKKYLGIVNTITPHPCAYLLFSDGDIREEFGLMKIKTGKVEHICACCDGDMAEHYKLLKNDLLKVAVVDLIHRVYKKIGVAPHPLPELIKICEKNKKVWNVYKNAWTMGINQVEQHGSAGRVSKYAPTNISELSAFVAAIRPGFQSYYSQFEAREPYEFGIKSLDNIIQTKEFPQSYMLYQENIMQVMSYAGIAITEAYDAIKNIAKKRKSAVLAYENLFVPNMVKRIISEGINQVKADGVARRTWQVIQDSCRYGFNACLSGNESFYQISSKASFMPTIQEMFLIKNDIKYAKMTGHLSLYKKYNRCGYGYTLSMEKNGELRKNKIIDIYCSNINNVYEIILENENTIRCTRNHKYPTPNGITKMRDLAIGDSLYVIDDCRENQKDLLTTTSKIISIKQTSEEIVYDIEMQSPYHNFVTKSGIVTSNSHAYSVAGDSLYGAYLKSHYPLDFYEVFLRMLEEDGNKDRLSKTRIEAEKAYDIQFPSFQFGQDNREIIADHDNNLITASLKTIKGFGNTVGRQLYELNQMFDGEDFVDLMVLAEENNMLSAKWEKLININYFLSFGKNLKLLKIFEEFRGGDSRYKRTHKDTTKITRLAELKEKFEKLPNKSLSFMKQIDIEQKTLGYIHFKLPRLDRRYIYVTRLDTRYAPRFQGYCLTNGKTESLKVYAKTFTHKKFKDGDILYCKKFEKKPPYKYISGEFVADMNAEQQWWVKVYDIIPYKQFEQRYNNILDKNK